MQSQLVDFGFYLFFVCLFFSFQSQVLALKDVENPLFGNKGLFL